MSLRKLHRPQPGRAGRVAAALLVTTTLLGCELPNRKGKDAAPPDDGAAAAADAPRTKSGRGGGTQDVGRSAEEIEKWLRAHLESDTRAVATRAQLEVVAEGKHWRVSFPDRLLSPGQPVAVEIVRHPAMTVMMVPLLRVPKNPPAEILGALLAQNYELYQAKLSLGPQGDLFVSYEVPNRLLDREELIDDLEDLSLLAQNITGLVEQRLVELALGLSPDGAQRQRSAQMQGPPPGAPQGLPPGMPQGQPPQGVPPPGEGLAQRPPELSPPGPAPQAPPLPPHLVPPSPPVAGTPEQ